MAQTFRSALTSLIGPYFAFNMEYLTALKSIIIDIFTAFHFHQPERAQRVNRWS